MTLFRFLAVLGFLILSACATTPSFQKFTTFSTDKDEAQHALDRETCRRFGYNADKVYLACMEKQGYQIRAEYDDGKTYDVKFSDIHWN